MNVDLIFQNFLVFIMAVMGLLIIVAVIRSILGPSTSDRIIAVNMIGTITIVLIAILTVYLGEDYLGDVCLIYAMISFLAVVVLAKVYTGVYLEAKGIKGNKQAIDNNLTNQKNITANEQEEDSNGNN